MSIENLDDNYSKPGFARARATIYVLSMVLLSMSAACASAHDLSDDPLDVETVIKDGRFVRFTDVLIYEDAGEIVVTGRARRTPQSPPGFYRGPIAVELKNAAGDTLGLVYVDLVPRNIPDSGSRSSRFTARFGMDLPPGCIVHISYGRVQDLDR